MPAPAPAPLDLSTGAHMVADDGHPLPLLGVELRAHAEAGLARVTLRQQFQNPYDEPLRVRYLVPLPADAAVGGYCFELPNERIVGEVARKHEARERFEQALVEGRSAALLEQQRSSVFEQEVGNIPPGALVTTELTIDQPLIWLSNQSEGAWEWRFPTVVAPRYIGAEGQVRDVAKLNVPVLDGAVTAGATLALTIADVARMAPYSPSHALASSYGADGWTVGIEGEAGSARLDRDVVIRWGVAAQTPGIKVSLARREQDDRALGLLTIVPPEPTAEREPVARDLILLIDVSGSMSGQPLAQAKRVIRALIDGLAPQDRLEMIAFGSRPVRWQTEPSACNPQARRDALAWVNGLQASGGTNMHTAIIEALAPLRDDAQRQILLISDGLIGFEQQIIAEAVTRLPSRSRVHCLGVGHGVNRSLTRPLARAGHGVELIVAPGEDVERAVGALLERTVEPLLVGLELAGEALIEAPLFPAGARGDLFAGAPTRLAIACRPEGGRLTVRARSAQGMWVQHVEVPAIAAGDGDAALIRHFAREQVEDVETLIAAGLARDGDARIERVGLRYGIATRMTSWIAVSAQVTVDPTKPTRTVEQPHELPAGMSAEGLGLRSATQGESREMVRNEQGVIVAAAPQRGEPKILGFINLPNRAGSAAPPPPAAPAPRGRASARKQREERAESPSRTRSPKPIRRKTQRSAPEPEQKKQEQLDRTAPAGAPQTPAAEVEERPTLRERLSAALGLGGKPQTVRAKIVLERPDQLVLTFVTPEALDWSPSTTLELRIGGRTIQVRLDVAATTAAGKLGAGVTVRLALTLDAALPSGALDLDVNGLRLTAKR
ncbi:MAG TPA: VIT domain-containing protein [Enhygromyxa sp.]|nr:VIT domain-containing protein [Enhygromyxa sp.]